MNYIPYIFRTEEILKNFDNKKQMNNYLFNLVSHNKIIKVRNNLYVSYDQMGIINANKFQIATKITNESYVSYHSALEYYGLTNQVYNEMIIGNPTRFIEFDFNDYSYICKVNNIKEEINYIENEGIRVTSLERTIIDCIDNINLAGSIEEILNALENIKIIDEAKLLKVLKAYDKIFLYQKVGYILEQYKKEMNLSNHFFDECQKRQSKQVKYFLNNEFKNIKYNSKWKLMAPSNIRKILNEGIE